MKIFPLFRRARQRSLASFALLVSALGLIGALAFSLAAQWQKASAAPAAQNLPTSADGVWQALGPAQNAPQGIPQNARSFRLNPTALERLLARAPQESSAPLALSPAVITLPLPNGVYGRFRLEESSILEPGLAARFPAIKSYRGQGLDDPRLSLRGDWSPQGFHALILGPDYSITIQPLKWGETLDYVSYSGLGSAETVDDLQCFVEGKTDIRPGAARRVERTTASGPTRRHYRIAIAATGEYSQAFGGGTVGGTVASINTWLNALNAIYERELALRLTLVNNTDIIYLDGATDPYTNGVTGTMLNEVRTDLRDKVGAGNYDAGHVLGTGGAGLAFVGAVCNNGEFNEDNFGPVKGGGVTLILPQFGNALSTNLIAHEIGHLFGAQHSFNATLGSCGNNGRAGASAVESGAGLTIMSYAGQCAPDNLTSSAELRFHAHSYTQITNYVTSGDGAACGTTVMTGNNPPTVNGGADYIIPRQTPFTLTATGSDADGNDAANLTYTWEQVDAGGPCPGVNCYSNPPYTDGNDASTTTRPLFRPYSPTFSPARTFPLLTYILNNANTAPATVNGFQTADFLPVVGRTLNFRVVARDQRGGVNDDDVQLTVDGNAGPFLVTSQDQTVSWIGGTQQNVTWSVNNTNNAPINCAEVSILLSTDGGQTFPVTLLANTPNDGSEPITVPQGIVTSTARIKVQAVGNVFFDINNANLGLVPGNTCPAIGTLSPLINSVGASVLITGVNFNDVTSVRFSPNINASFLALSDSLITATVPAGAVSGPLSLIKAGCPNAVSAYFTVCPSGSTTLKVDDNTLEAAFGYTTGSTSAYVNRLTPSSYPATLGSVVAAINRAQGTSVELIYAAHPDGDANIDGLIFQSVSTSVLQQASLVSYSVPPLTINSGDFVVGFRIVPAAGEQPAVLDIDSAVQGRSYYSSDAANFNPFSGGLAANLAVRAVVFNGCGEAGPACPTVSNLTPASGSFGSTVTLTGTNFTDVTSVKFSNNVSAQFTIDNATTITATVPNDAVSGPITVSKTGCADAQSAPFTLACPVITLEVETLPGGIVNAAYSQILSASGGVPSYSYAVTAGSLPNGLTLAANGTLAGAPVQVGDFTFTVTATDVNGCTGMREYTLTVGCQSITVNPASLASATLNEAYLQAFSQVGGVGTIQWSYTGTLPAGLSFNEMTGELNGTPTETGTFNLTVTARDANLCTGQRAYMLFVSNCPALTVNPATLSNGTTGLAYSELLSATGGTEPYSFTVAGGTLPTGLGLAGNGALTGTPTQAGMFSFTVRATDPNVCIGERMYTMLIDCPAITLGPPALPAGLQGSAYSAALTASGGTAPYTFALAMISGNLPAGIVLGTDGALTGTPTAAGTFNFTVNATDANNCPGSHSFTLVINSPCPALTLSPESLPNINTGTPFSLTFTASGGSSPYLFSLDSGTLPMGLTLNANGQLGGTPLQTGSFNFVVRALDAQQCSGTRSYTLTVACGDITITPASLPGGFSGTAFAQTFAQTGGSGATTWSVSNGTLPNGLMLNASSGALTGTPTAVGVSNFTLRVTDANGCFGERGYTLIISGNGLLYYPLSKPIRLLDTRAPIPGFPACASLNQLIPAGGELLRQARLTCDGVTIPANAAAIVGNATVTATQEAGFATLYPDGVARPPVATLTYGLGETAANAFTVGLDGAGEFRAYSSAGTHLILDVTGYFAPPSTGGLYYHPLPNPIRLLDTRAPIQGFPACAALNQPLLTDGEITRLARTTCQGLTIPNDALAIVGNGTVTATTNAGFLTLYPNGVARPPVANLLYTTGQTISNAFTVGLDSSGQFKVYSSAGTHFIMDVSGYYSTSPVDVNGTGLLFSPLSKPIRLFDTRASIPGFPACEFLNQPLLANQEIVRSAHTTCDGVTIPATAAALVGNGTVTAPDSFGFLTMYPNGQTRPPVANLTYLQGQTVPNAYTIGLDGMGQFLVYTTAGTHFILDVTGYYAP
jgi:hypothetical protein